LGKKSVPKLLTANARRENTGSKLQRALHAAPRKGAEAKDGKSGKPPLGKKKNSKEMCRYD